MKNQRNETRLEAKERARVTLLGHPDVTVPCLVRNVSRSGMCIDVRKTVPEGRILKVDWGGHLLFGRVRTVAQAGVDFRLGMELLYCSRWAEPIASALEEAG